MKWHKVGIRKYVSDDGKFEIIKQDCLRGWIVWEAYRTMDGFYVGSGDTLKEAKSYCTEERVERLLSIM